jgi:two-component system copper resistance phosphate regulon response regulator CusR
MRILVIEDEKNLASFIEKGLSQAGHQVAISNDGNTGLNLATGNDFDIILLDLMLPGINGFDILKNLRSFSVETPVIILSALTETAQVVKGLDLGAVDYIKKPFDFEELLARVRVLQKKITGNESLKIVIEDLVIDTVARKVFRANKEIRLTAKEFQLLNYLAQNKNRVMSKAQIMENVWEFDFDPGSNIVEVHMHQLRKKMDKDYDVQLIETVVGLGYCLKG